MLRRTGNSSFPLISCANLNLHLSLTHLRTHTAFALLDPTKGIIVKEGDDLRLLCDVLDGNPLNVTKVKWIKSSGQDASDVVINETSQNEIVWMAIGE